jgi:hypothetical protein
MRTRSTPRQIAIDVIQSLGLLTADFPALQRRRWPSGNPMWRHTFPEALRAALLAGTRMPRLPGARRPGWFAISAAAGYAGDVMVCARAADTASAWTAAAEALYWHGVGEGYLGTTAVRFREAEFAKRMKAIADAHLRKARAAAVKAITTRDGRDWRECAREIDAGNNPATGRPWATREQAKAYIGEKFNKSRSAVDRALSGAERHSSRGAVAPYQGAVDP